MVEYIIKRDDSKVKYDLSKIEVAISKAFDSVGLEKDDLPKIVKNVDNTVSQRFTKTTPSVEDVSDIIEEVLMDYDYHSVSKSFIIYREYRRKLRDLKTTLSGTKIKNKLSVNALRILEARYFLRDQDNNIIENADSLFRRISDAIASVEGLYNKDPKVVEEYSDKFYEFLNSLDFVPNSPTIMNAGTDLGQLSACFVLPVDDSIHDIFDAVKFAAIIHQSGGGTGFSFSRLRPKGSMVKSSHGVASGPISFMKAFDTATEVIKQGGKRRGANMAILRVDHPDILEFITAKQREGDISNFNMSVALTDKFMDALKEGREYELIVPHNGEVVSKMNAKSVFDLITNMAWTNGEPGVIFIDEMNRYNMLPHIGKIEATNPCGEQPLLPYESCNLGAINLANMIEDEKIDWKKLRDVVNLAVRFLDNVIDANKYPLPQIDKMSKSSRKIGLGVMGFADMLLQLNISYASDNAVYLAEKVMKFVQDSAIESSVKLAEERGNFPAFKGSRWGEEKGYKNLRNAALTTIAPTGTTSMIADCSSGIEPLFSIAYTKVALDDKEFVYVNKYFERVAKKRGFYSENLMYKIAKEGSIQHIDEIPDDVKKIFVTTHDIETNWHIRMQAAFQKYNHSSVSKTINMPCSASVDDVKEAYLDAYELGCKGLTIYREGSRNIEVLKKGTKERTKEEKEDEKKTIQKKINKKEVPKDECPICKKKMQAIEGCYTCQSCGYSKCSS